MLGDNLKILRKKKGFNKKQMAQELGLQYMTYCRYEGNEREPSTDVLVSIADYFNITVDYLIGNALKFDIYPREYEESEMRCPECGCEHIHFIRTMAVEFGNEKSTGCSIEFRCEKGHNFYLVFETFKGCTYNMYFGKNAATVRHLKTGIYDSGIYSLEDAFVEEIFEQKMKEYKVLDSYGKKAVNCIIDAEYERCLANSEEGEESIIEIRHSYYKVSAGKGFDLGNDDDWETIDVPDTKEARKADFALTIKGNSMEPVYFDGDIVLVKGQAAVDVGEIGIFIVDGKGYIKKFGGDRLISLNAEYDDIIFSEHDDERIRCVGKVIGRV